MSLLDNVKIAFGDGVTDDDKADFYSYTILDDLINPTDSEGKAKSSFSVEETVNLFTQLKPGWKIASLAVTDGDYNYNGIVSRSYSQSRLFFVDKEQSLALNFYPASELVKVFYGNTCSFKITGRDVLALAPPVIVDFTYNMSGHSIAITPPPNLVVEDGDSYPIGIVITVVTT